MTRYTADPYARDKEIKNLPQLKCLNRPIIFNRACGPHTNDITMHRNRKIIIPHINFEGAGNSVKILSSSSYTEVPIKNEATEDFPNNNNTYEDPVPSEEVEVTPTL